MKTKHTLTTLAMALFMMISGQVLWAQQPTIGYFRQPDQSGVNVFESPVEDDNPFEGVKVRVGGNFAQQFQGLSHENTASFKAGVVNGQEIDLNQLYPLGNGFNLATANLNLDVQLAKGVRLNVISYLSARHHPEAWVKGGYIQFDELSIFNNDKINNIMDRVTIKVGHTEVNYGDQHFRRSDNGNALYNPFVGNYIMDAFATEIGGEVYYRPSDFIFMVGLTSGIIKGDVNGNNEKNPSVILKAGWDKQVSDDLRLRLTGSMYANSGSARNTLYAGDRAGSRYYLAMEGEYVSDRSGAIMSASESAQFTSGRMNPDLTYKINAVMINPFVKFKGLELFGTYERASGRNSRETEDRVWNQIAADVIYRFMPREQLFIGGRYNTVSGPLAGSTTDVTVNRSALAAGWFVTKNVVAKLEYVNQKYEDFETSDIRNGGQFNGVMIEAVVGF